MEQGEGVGASKGGDPEESHPRFLASKCLNSIMSHACVWPRTNSTIRAGQVAENKIVDTESLED